MEYKVILEKFEGPLDLLLHLIEKSQVDIYDIQISTITDQYIQYLEDLKEVNLEITSEFLVMAATLLEIKSRMLLPNSKDIEGEQLQLEEIDPREELIRKLIEYKKYKTAAEELKLKEEIQKKVFFKPKEEIGDFEYDDDELVLDGVTLGDLIGVFNRVINKVQDLPKKHTFSEIQRDEITIEESMSTIIQKLHDVKPLMFEELFEDIITKSKMVITFLAVLELIKLKRVIIKQDNNFDDIILHLRKT